MGRLLRWSTLIELHVVFIILSMTFCGGSENLEATEPQNNNGGVLIGGENEQVVTIDESLSNTAITHEERMYREGFDGEDDVLSGVGDFGGVQDDYAIVHNVHRSSKTEDPEELGASFEEPGGGVNDDQTTDNNLTILERDDMQPIQYSSSSNLLDRKNDDSKVGQQDQPPPTPKYPLFVFIIGGLRWDYINSVQNLTAFKYLKEHGSTLQKVTPVFPTEVFPVWTSIATGKYPEQHNINGNIMFDLRSRTFFNALNYKNEKKNRVLGADEATTTNRRNKMWWESGGAGDSVFWAEANRLTTDLNISIFNWHDCFLENEEFDRHRKENSSYQILDYCIPFKWNQKLNKLIKKRRQKSSSSQQKNLTKTNDDSGESQKYDVEAFETQIDELTNRAALAHQLDLAFMRLYRKHFNLAVVHTDAVREATRFFGPHSKHMKRVLHELDDLLQALLIDVKAKEERAGIKMNVLVISDFGSTSTEELEPIYLDSVLDFDLIQYVIVGSGYATIIPYVLEHKNILRKLQSDELLSHGADIYLASHLDAFNDPITELAKDDTYEEPKLFPENLRYRNGRFTQDILIVTRPAFELMIQTSNPKVIRLPFSASPYDNVKARSGFNPYFVEPKYPKLKIVKRKQLTEKQKKAIHMWEQYDKLKDDTKTTAFAMGPDFKSNYISYENFEVIDFHTMIAKLMNLPPTEFRADSDLHHQASLRRISDIMVHSSGTSSHHQQLAAYFITPAYSTLILLSFSCSLLLNIALN